MVVESSDPTVPNTIGEVVAALRKHKLKAKHDKQDWGDWIVLQGCETVIAIESIRGLTTQATIEESETDPETVLPTILAAFAELGWQGNDEEGIFGL